MVYLKIPQSAKRIGHSVKIFIVKRNTKKRVRACALKRYACLREAASAKAGRASVSVIRVRKKQKPFSLRIESNLTECL
jgi:DTW domain-containing protein YfiP